MSKLSKIKVSNMDSPRSGKAVANQFVITTPQGDYFQSYNTLIVFQEFNGKTYLDKSSWDYSVTTGKYRNNFLGETKKDTERKIKSGEYILTDLN